MIQYPVGAYKQTFSAVRFKAANDPISDIRDKRKAALKGRPPRSNIEGLLRRRALTLPTEQPQSAEGYPLEYTLPTCPIS